jgi:hypothetical protein
MALRRNENFIKKIKKAKTKIFFAYGPQSEEIKKTQRCSGVS